jgi:hypothetical protein
LIEWDARRARLQEIALPFANLERTFAIRDARQRFAFSVVWKLKAASAQNAKGQNNNFHFKF